MNCTILLHSTTGNTRLVARFARGHLERRGHRCAIHDVGRRREVPSLDATDLLCVASPTMYFRPTYAMERAIARLPVAANGPKPAFLLATNAGDTGAHLTMLAEQLVHKDYVVLGGHVVTSTSNWPPRRAVVRRAAFAEPIADLVASNIPGARRYLTLLYPDLKGVSPLAPSRLEAFLDDMVDRAKRGMASREWTAPPPGALPQGTKPTVVAGRMMQVHMMRKATDIAIDADRCSRCGTCVMLCPVECLTRTGDDDVPTVGTGCTGCWACFNGCPDKAISGFGAPSGAGQYRGPSGRDRSLLTVPRDG